MSVRPGCGRTPRGIRHDRGAKRVCRLPWPSQSGLGVGQNMPGWRLWLYAPQHDADARLVAPLWLDQPRADRACEVGRLQDSVARSPATKGPAHVRRQATVMAAMARWLTLVPPRPTPIGKTTTSRKPAYILAGSTTAGDVSCQRILPVGHTDAHP